MITERAQGSFSSEPTCFFFATLFLDRPPAPTLRVSVWKLSRAAMLSLRWSGLRLACFLLLFFFFSFSLYFSFYFLVFAFHFLFILLICLIFRASHPLSLSLSLSLSLCACASVSLPPSRCFSQRRSQHGHASCAGLFAGNSRRCCRAPRRKHHW